MIYKLIITVIMFGLCTLTYAQDQSQAVRELFRNKMPTARERGLDSLQKMRPAISSFIEKMNSQKPSLTKSSSTFTSRLDSLVSDFFFKASFVYDANGNSILEVLSVYQLPGGWSPNQQVETTYNPENLPVERIFWIWDPVLMELQMVMKETYSYQEGGLFAEIVNYEWDGDEWVNSIRLEIAYDDQENLTEAIYYLWDETNQDFGETMQQIYEYTASGGLLEMTVSFWDQESWVASNIEVYELNPEDQPLSKVLLEWLIAEETWAPQIMVEYAYNESGYETEIVYYAWSDETFFPEGKLEAGYDDQDQLISEEFFFWEDNEWTGSFLDTYAYDSEDNLLEYTLHAWHGVFMEYVPEAKQINTFDTATPSSHIMSPEGYDEFYNNKILSTTILYFEIGEWIENESVNYYYSPLFPTSVNESKEHNFLVYPNPFRETIRFSGSDQLVKFTLFDLQGRLVVEKQLLGAVEINSIDLPAGMYVYQIDGMNSRQVGKLVRE